MKLTAISYYRPRKRLCWTRRFQTSIWPNNGITTTYVYDGLQAVEEHQQSGPTTTQLAGGLDEVFFRKTGTNVEFLLTDALGSTWALADSNGQVNSEYKYDVFGQTQASGQSSNNPLQYTGRENDGTGLYYYRNRYYSPGLRRFIARDPLREAAGENEYSYVGNNPVSYTDPLGLMQDEPWNPLNNPSGNMAVDVVSQGVNILVDGDAVAQDAQTIGNHCLPISERRWAAARMAFTIVSAAVGGVVIGKALRFLGQGLKRIPWGKLSRVPKKACFVAGTLIHTRTGLVPIEEIKAGDEILSYNEESQLTEYNPVIETYARQTETIIELQIEGETKPIETTPEHPFFVKVHRARDDLGSGDDEGEWQAAGRLQVGDEVLLKSGQWERVLSVNRQARSEQVYNFAVENNHNYFVGRNGALVHNQCMTPDQIALKELVAEATNKGTKPLSVDNAETVLDWAAEVKYPGVRANARDVASPSNWNILGNPPHIHLKGIAKSDHIPVMPGVKPRKF